MAQDLRKMFKQDREKENYPMQKGHEKRFLELLNKEIPEEKKSSLFRFKIAASIVILFGLGIYYFSNIGDKNSINATVVNNDGQVQETIKISFGDLSPDLKRVEDYYVANINIELSQLEVSEENKALVDSFMERLSELNQEYETLNTELNEIGPNDQTISALIKNLQLRLQLLYKLKNKLIELKLSKNEQII